MILYGVLNFGTIAVYLVKRQVGLFLLAPKLEATSASTLGILLSAPANTCCLWYTLAGINVGSVSFAFTSHFKFQGGGLNADVKYLCMRRGTWLYTNLYQNLVKNLLGDKLHPHPAAHTPPLRPSPPCKCQNALMENEEKHHGPSISFL